MVEPVADRATVRTRDRAAAVQPLLHQRFHFVVRELVAQLYRRVARNGGRVRLSADVDDHGSQSREGSKPSARCVLCRVTLTAVFSVVDPRSMMRAKPSSDGVLNHSHMHGVHGSMSPQPAVDVYTSSTPTHANNGEQSRSVLQKNL